MVILKLLFTLNLGFYIIQVVSIIFKVLQIRFQMVCLQLH
nr:MAG TPA: hypothetical protein [Bacteriophage sp.]